MTNVLVILSTPGDREGNRLALLPRSKLGLTDSQIDAIDGVDVEDDDLKDELKDSIVRLFKRFGLESSKTIKPDLKQYLDPKPPIITVDRIIRISWSV